MDIINYVSNIAMPVIITIILLYGILEKKNVFDIFLKGAKDGALITVRLLPTLVGLFVAIGMLKSSGIIDFIINMFDPFLKLAKIPSEIMPLAIIRPISGSSSIAIATEIMKEYGVDSKIGLIASTIMGSTETTLYTIAVYTSAIKVKKTRFVLGVALLADFVGIMASIGIWGILSKSFS